MKHLFSKSKSKRANKDEEEADTQPKTLAELVEATRVETASSRYQSWDCVALEHLPTTNWAKALNEWADLAYKGDWEGLLRTGLERSTLINSRRLQKQIGPGGTQRRPSAGFTALHQAAWHGAPVEIVQALINLGAHRAHRLF